MTTLNIVWAIKQCNSAGEFKCGKEKMAMYKQGLLNNRDEDAILQKDAL